MPRSTAGFTALELLLVLMTIAVLATLYVMALKSLPERAKVAESLGLAGAMRNEMAFYYANYGEWPDHDTLVNTAQPKRAGNYTHSIVIEQDALSVTVATPTTYQYSLRPLIKTEVPHTLWLLCGYAPAPPEWLVLGDNHSDIPVSYLPHLCR